MKSGGQHSVIFSPIPRRAGEAGEKSQANGKASVKLHEEPEDDIRLLGEMVRDVATMEEMLKSLLFANAEEYRGNLRVVRGAAERLRQRCTQLIGDADP